jgi:hypothetical protein
MTNHVKSNVSVLRGSFLGRSRFVVRLIQIMVLFGSGSGKVIFAEQLPNTTDLLAAYCFGFDEARLVSIDEMLEELKDFQSDEGAKKDHHQKLQEFRTQTERNLRRLRLYLYPRMSHLSTDSLVTAKQSGKEDFSQLGVEMQELLQKKGPDCRRSCFAESRPENRKPSFSFSACTQSCIDSWLAKTAWARTLRCKDTNFLPMRFGD